MTISGLLLDLEGVLYQGDAPIPGAIEAVDLLRSRGLALRFLTNTTTNPRAKIAARMTAIGFAAEPSHVFAPGVAAGGLLRRDGIRRVYLAAPEPLTADFADFDLVDEAAEAVVMGDLHRDFDWDRLNHVFALVRNGARLIALHKNRVCRRGGDIALDLGPFVAAVEYAAGVEAELVGKPAPAFFEMALADMGLSAGDVAMVGDDIEADIGGAQRAGLRAVQVRTGKYTERDDDHPTVKPDARIDSIADLAVLTNTAF